MNNDIKKIIKEKIQENPTFTAKELANLLVKTHSNYTVNTLTKYVYKVKNSVNYKNIKACKETTKEEVKESRNYKVDFYLHVKRNLNLGEKLTLIEILEDVRILTDREKDSIGYAGNKFILSLTDEQFIELQNLSFIDLKRNLEEEISSTIICIKTNNRANDILQNLNFLSSKILNKVYAFGSDVEELFNKERDERISSTNYNKFMPELNSLDAAIITGIHNFSPEANKKNLIIITDNLINNYNKIEDYTLIKNFSDEFNLRIFVQGLEKVELEAQKHYLYNKFCTDAIVVEEYNYDKIKNWL